MEEFNPELEQEANIPRPRRQVWGARIALAGVLIQFELSGGIGGDAAAVTHTGAVDDCHTGFQDGYRAGNVIEHKETSKGVGIMLSSQC